MGSGVANTIGSRQLLQTKAGQTVFSQWPLDTLGTQCIGGTNHIDNIPTRIAILPLPGIGIMKVSVQRVARDLIVKPQRVITDTASPGTSQFFQYLSNEFALRHTLAQCCLRRYSGNQAGLRMGQYIIGGPGVNNQGLANNV